MSQKDKTALVTGGSGGIGYEFAKIMASKGYNLVLSSRNQTSLERIKTELEAKFSVKVEVIPSDLSKPGEALRLSETCDQKGIVVDILINNAGAGLFGESVLLDIKETEAMMFLNMQSLTTLCSLFGKKMKKRGEGRILNVGSMAGDQPTPFFASYAASKSYVLNYSLALRQELKAFGVKVTCVQPGYVRTSFDDNSQIKSDSYKKFSEKNSLPPETVAKIGVSMMFRNKPFGLAGVSNKISGFFSKLIPRSLKPVVLSLAIKKIAK